MDVEGFLRPYPDRMSPADIHRGQHSEYMYDAQEYSYQWGRVLHALLSEGEDKSALQELNLDAYTHWLQDGFDASPTSLEDVPADLRPRVLNETNFHFMNQCLAHMWQPLASERWESPAERASALSAATFGFAFHGLHLYVQRERFIKEAGGTHALFEPENKATHEALTGLMQEYDAAIVLINFMRKYKNLTLLPAPLQFERTDKRTNVDFIVVDFVDSRAIGVQVKSRVRREDVDGADASRVVFIDGDVDLGNVKLVRTQRAHSTQRLVAWPGIIAAKTVDTFKAHGTRARQLSANAKVGHFLAQNPKLLVQRQMLARELVGDIKVYHDEIAEIIGERILKKL
jgi:hypothetical protein